MTSPHRLKQIAAVGVIIAGIRLFEVWLALTGGELPLVTGVVVALALLFGPLVAWGVALGHLTADLVLQALTLASAIEVITQFLLAGSVCWLWGSFGRVSSGQRPGELTIRNIPEYFLTSIAGVLLSVSVTAWGFVLFDMKPFSVTIVERLPGALVSVVTVGVVALYVGTKILAVRETDEFWLPDSQGTAGIVVAAVAFLWVVGGYFSSLIFQSTDLLVRHQLVNQVGRGVLWLLTLAGPDGIYIQAGGGLLAVSLCLWGFMKLTDSGN